jgi:uncharacterized coiled-coil protein SlyX
VLLGPYVWDDGRHEDGVRGDVLKAVGSVWDETVTRGGGKISVLQEVADAKTLGQQNKAALAELTETVAAQSKVMAAQQATLARMSEQLGAALTALQQAAQPPATPPAT